jgi:putative transposase
VTALRGWIRTEVGRVLNRLAQVQRPSALVLERLNFQNPALSSRLNRIIQNCGRTVIKAKLADLADRFGIVSEEVNPAYTSQTSSVYGHVDKNNLWLPKIPSGLAPMHRQANIVRAGSTL